jgi:membrane associated rhomboid family serine protease
MMFPPITTVVKNIIIINVLMFVASLVFKEQFFELMSGHYLASDLFKPWQIITHMFMHGGFSHILFNMFGVFFFGTYLERHWGSQRFLIYYMICGLGAFALHFLIVYLRMQQIEPLLTPEDIQKVIEEGPALFRSGRNWVGTLGDYNSLINGSVVGASGALFGLLIGFGLIFPEVRVMLLFPPIPIKARVLALGYGAFELLMAFQNNPGDNVAHFAHLGGMLVGYIMLKIWQKRGSPFY